VAQKRRPAITVVLADDEQTFADALGIALRLEKGFAVHVTTRGEHAVAVSEQVKPDVVLMDLEMPGIGGVTAIRQIRRVHPPVRVLAISGHDHELDRARAVEAGAVGFLSKQLPVADVAEAIRTVHRGQHLIDVEEVHRLLRLLRKRRHQVATERQRVGRLTPRQTEILQLMAEGVSPPEIAARLHMSPQTVRTHVFNILTRLGAHSKLEAITVAIRQGRITTG
jgi:DNA-binding NarL/FixJ family response regulator